MQPYSSGTGNIDPGADSDILDLRAIFSVVRVNLTLLISVFIAVFVVCVGLSFLLPSKYTSSSSVMVGGKDINVSADPKQATTDAPADSAAVDSEVEILKSVAIADAVSNELHLDQDPEFNPALKKGGVLSFLHHGADTTPDTIHQEILNNLTKVVSVKRQGLTRVITVSVETESPAKSAHIADAWVNAYIMRSAQVQSNSLGDVNKQLSSRLDDLRAQANEADKKLQDYKISHGLTSDGDSTLPEQQVYFLQQQLALANTDVAGTQARLAAARRQGPAGSVDPTQGSDTLRDLRGQQATLSANLAQLTSRYGDLHPEVIKTKQALAAINAQIQAESARMTQQLQTDADTALQKQRSIQASLGAAQGKLNNNLSSNVELRDLQLAADTAHTVYEGYLQRYKDISTQQGLSQDNVRIISTAKIPTTRSSPKMAMIAVLAFALAAFAAVVAVAVKHAFRRGITSGTEVTNQLGVPFLGNVADLKSTLTKPIKGNVKLWDYIEANPLSVFAEQYKILANAANIGAGVNAKRVVAITSAIPGEGKTTTSMCLAKAIQMRGQSVVVVDCDLRRRSVTAQLGQSYEYGVVEVLEGAVPLEKALFDGGKGVIYLPVSTNPVPAENLFDGTAIVDLLEQLKSHFDVVILDTAPVLPIVDTRVLARHADEVIVLAKWGDTPVGATRTALDILHNAQLDNIAGVALTLVDIRKQAMLSGASTEYYYKAYKSYYAQ